MVRQCKICSRRHYARGYCRGHYNNLRAGRRLSYPSCKVCGSKVTKHIKEELCCFHYRENIRYKKDGGEWGYKGYRAYIKGKKANCEICGKEGKLCMHHKDLNTRNDDRLNLLTVCGGCHKKLHNPHELFKRMKAKRRWDMAQKRLKNFGIENPIKEVKSTTSGEVYLLHGKADKIRCTCIGNSFRKTCKHVDKYLQELKGE